MFNAHCTVQFSCHCSELFGSLYTIYNVHKHNILIPLILIAGGVVVVVGNEMVCSAWNSIKILTATTAINNMRNTQHV